MPFLQKHWMAVYAASLIAFSCITGFGLFVIFQNCPRKYFEPFMNSSLDCLKNGLVPISFVLQTEISTCVSSSQLSMMLQNVINHSKDSADPIVKSFFVNISKQNIHHYISQLRITLLENHKAAREQFQKVLEESEEKIAILENGELKEFSEIKSFSQIELFLHSDIKNIQNLVVGDFLKLQPAMLLHKSLNLRKYFTNHTSLKTTASGFWKLDSCDRDIDVVNDCGFEVAKITQGFVDLQGSFEELKEKVSETHNNYQLRHFQGARRIFQRELKKHVTRKNYPALANCRDDFLMTFWARCDWSYIMLEMRERN